MDISLYHVDAFTSRVFSGNPAAVCPLAEWLDDALLQTIAAENNLSETAFIVPVGEDYEIRWFTPVREVDLCGHATLAAAHALFRHLQPGRSRVTFLSESGPLAVAERDGLLAMDFPARPAEPLAEIPLALVQGLRAEPEAVFAARDLMAVYPDEETIRTLEPDMERLARLDCLGVIATAPGCEVDFVSRFFAPRAGLPEDPVTGSAHCTLVPYWAERLGKSELTARQLSARGGALSCALHGERVEIAGEAVTYLLGTLSIDA